MPVPRAGLSAFAHPAGPEPFQRRPRHSTSRPPALVASCPYPRATWRKDFAPFPIAVHVLPARAHRGPRRFLITSSAPEQVRDLVPAGRRAHAPRPRVLLPTLQGGRDGARCAYKTLQRQRSELRGHCDRVVSLLALPPAARGSVRAISLQIKPSDWRGLR